MSFELPALPYAKDALAPHISQETVEFHYGKHHAGYVTKLNATVKGTPLAEKSLEELIKTQTGGVFNLSAQIWNHTFYWQSMAPTGRGGGRPTGRLAALIDEAWGSFEKFQAEFDLVAGGHFGSGWAWLVQTPEGKLKIVGTHDADTPLRSGEGKPLITCDVWEHAYYIDYRNARPEYLKAWWNLVNWEFAASNLSA